jgi:hypothetical protein
MIGWGGGERKRTARHVDLWRRDQEQVNRRLTNF